MVPVKVPHHPALLSSVGEFPSVLLELLRVPRVLVTVLRRPALLSSVGMVLARLLTLVLSLLLNRALALTTTEILWKRRSAGRKEANQFNTTGLEGEGG
jgi:hypothetical protein